LTVPSYDKRFSLSYAVVMCVFERLTFDKVMVRFVVIVYVIKLY